MGFSKTINGNRYKDKYWKERGKNNKISNRHSKTPIKIKRVRKYEKKDNIKK